MPAAQQGNHGTILKVVAGGSAMQAELLHMVFIQIVKPSPTQNLLVTFIGLLQASKSVGDLCERLCCHSPPGS